MSRLVEAKVELAIALDRRNAADMEFRSAAARCQVGETAPAWKRLQAERGEVSRLTREVGEVVARESGLVREFGPGAAEEIS